VVDPRDVPPPTVEEARKIVAMLEAMDPRKADIEDYQHFFRQLVHAFSITTPRFDAGNRYYRSRQGGRRSKVSELTHPPAESVTALGRANRVGESMFYCATSRIASAFEWKVSAGEEAVICQWELTDEIRLAHVGYSNGVFADNQSARDVPVWATNRATEGRTETEVYVDGVLANFFSRRVKSGETHLSLRAWGTARPR